jgi:serine/threonine protein phosphatase PrpC
MSNFGRFQPMEDMMKIDVSIVSVPRRGKPITEDAYVIVNESGLPFFVAVVDGHGPGDDLNRETVEFSACVVKNLERAFRANPLAEQFPNMFKTTQHAVEKRFGDLPFGAVATCIVMDDFGLNIAQAGDCRLYRFDSSARYGTDLLTQDHVVETVTEMVRLRPFYDSGKFRPMDHGGMGIGDFAKQRLHFKTPEGEWSSYYLEPTRGFGDPDFRPAFTHVPETKFVAVQKAEVTLFALCSDGGNRVVIDAFTQLSHGVKIDDFEHVVRTVEAVMPDEPRDDVTVILIRFSPAV